MESETSVLAVISFFLSAGLVLLRLWETFLRKPAFVPEFRWSEDPQGVVDGASLVIMNIGSAKGAILRVGFGRGSDDLSYWTEDLFQAFPLVVDVNEVTRRFEIPLTAPDPLALGLRDGTLTKLMIEDIRNQTTSHELPAFPIAG